MNSLPFAPAQRRARTTVAGSAALLAPLLALCLYQPAFAQNSASPPPRPSAGGKPPAAPVPAQYADPAAFGDVLHSVSRLKAFLNVRRAQEAAYKKAVEEAKKAGKTPPPKPARRGHKTDWYEARLHRIEMRAAPDDGIDPEDYARAQEHREDMPAARILLRGQDRDRGTGPGSGDAQLTAASPQPQPPVGVNPRPPAQITPPPSARWEFIGPRNLPVPYTIYYGPSGSATSGRVNGLAFAPNDPNTLYLAAAGGGIWKTTNGGTNWTPLGDAFPFLQTTSVAVHPTNPDTVYVGLGDHHGQDDVGYSRGIMRSTDGGASWTNVGRTQMSGQPVSAIVIDPENPSIVTASTGHGTGTTYLWRSVDAGTTWARAKIGTADAAGTWNDLEAGVMNANTGVRLYWAARQGVGVYVSSDRGATWSQVTVPSTNLGSGFELAASAVDPNIVYYINSGDQRVFKGIRNPTTGAVTWADITGGSFPNGNNDYNWSQAWYDFHLNCAAQSVGGVVRDVLYAGLITIVATKDDGATWTDIGVTYTSSARTHNDQHCIAFYPGDPNRMAIGNDGGVYGMTYNPTGGTWTIGGATWSRTLGITQFYYTDFHPTDPNRMLGGTQDNATPAARGDLFNWLNVGGGDGGGSVINPLNPLIQYATSQGYGGPYRSSNGWSNGNSYSIIDPGNFPAVSALWDQEPKPFIGIMSIDPNYPNYLYLGGRWLWRWDNVNGQWAGRLGNTQMTTGTIRAITVAPTDSRVIYVGGSDGNLMMTTNGGATWSRIDVAPVPDRVITDISVHPANPFDILFTLGGAGGSAGNVFRCQNTLGAPRVFQNRSGSGATAVPSIHHSSVTRDFTDPDGTFYVGTDVGVFMTDDGGLTWENATQPLGLPNVEVSTVRAMPKTGYLMASTYGRGVWRIPLVDNIPTRTPDIRVTQSVSKVGTEYRFNVSFTNVGPVTATTTRVTSAQLRVGTTTYAPINTLPINLPNVAPGATVSAVIRFDAPGLAAGTPAQFGFNGTFNYSGQSGTFGSAGRVTLP